MNFGGKLYRSWSAKCFNQEQITNEFGFGTSLDQHAVSKVVLVYFSECLDFYQNQLLKSLQT